MSQKTNLFMPLSSLADPSSYLFRSCQGPGLLRGLGLPFLTQIP